MRPHESTPPNDRGPALTFVVPVFDPPVDVFVPLLESIANQTCRDWECLLVDDGSHDPDVVTLIRDRTKTDPRFIAIHRTRNGGIAAATNDGLDAATGRIVAFADHDDLVDPEAVAAILEHFERHPADDVVYTDEIVIDRDGVTMADFHKPDYSPIRHLGQHYLAHMVACRRAAIGDLRVRREFEPAQDVDFVLRVIERAEARGRSVGHIPRQLYAWRAIAGSSALDAGEKPEMCEAVRRSIQAALDRRGIDHRVSTVEFDGRPTTSVRLDLEPVPNADIDVVDVDASTDVADVAQRLAVGTRRFVWLRPPGEHPPDAAGRLAAELTVGGRAVSAPQLVADDGRLLSAGRVIEPTLSDPLTGGTPGPGPWGAFLVTRECSAVAPWGAMLDRAAVADAGGLSADLGLDVGIAELSIRLARRDLATVWSQAVSLVVDDDLIGALDPTAVDDAWTLARPRLGDAAEHHQANGIAHLQHQRPAAITDARRRILRGDVDLLTCDVFDTLVTRSVARPSDLFLTLAGRLHAAELLSHDVSPPLFARARRLAEHRARVEVAATTTDRLPECTLTEIWSEMPGGWISDVDQAIDAELTHESEHLTVIRPAAEIVRLAVERGIPVTLVSDIYMSSDQLRDVLTRASLDVVSEVEVVTSADHRLAKSDGLLAQVIEQHGLRPDRVLHIGDNEISDVATAADLGAVAIEVEIPKRFMLVPRPSTALEAYSTSHGTDGGITAAVRAALVATPSGIDPAYQFGAAACGPALSGFARWASVTAERLGAGAVHCMLREGALIADLIHVMAPDGPPTRLVHASRWVDMRAAVVDGTPDEIYCALARRADLRVDDIHAAFGLDPAELRRLVGDGPIPPHALQEASRRLADDASIRGQIVGASAALRTRVMRQLRRELSIDNGPIVLCDVGWGGTIQEGITRILRDGGVDNEVIGLYFALSAPGEDRQAQGGRMLSFLPNVTDSIAASSDSRVVSHHADSIERILTPQTGTLLDIDDDGLPLLDTRPQRQPPSLAGAQQGLLDCATQIASRRVDDRVWVDDVDFRAALGASLAHVIELPHPEIAARLVSWRHDDVAGTATQALAGGHHADLVSRINVRDVDEFRRGKVGWVEGTAAMTNPALTAQVAARRAGIPIDCLAPGSEAGESRLAAFPIGSKMASLQRWGHLGTHPDGWSVMQITGQMDSVRSVRFDAGTEPSIVQLEQFRIVIERPSSTIVIDATGFEATAHAIEWVAAHPIGPRRFASSAGGHLAVPISADVGGEPCALDVVVVFRRWVVDDDDPILVPSTRHRVRQVADRAGRLARRISTTRPR